MTSLESLPGPDWSGMTVPVDEIGVDGDNPNEMSDEVFSELVTNISQYGWVGGPILLKPRPDDAGEDVEYAYVVSDGEHRWQAAKDLGLQKVPAVVQDDWSEADRRLLRQRMNKIHGEHDERRDALEYDWLADAGKRDAVLDLLDARDESFDEYMDLVRVNPTRPLDRDLDVDTNVHFMDCVAGMREHLADDSVDVVFTSPPYNVGKGDAVADHQREAAPAAYSDDRDEGEYQDFLRDVCEELARVVKPGGHIFINHVNSVGTGMGEPSMQWLPGLLPDPWEWTSFIVWDKGEFLTSGGLNNQQVGGFAINWEPIYHFTNSPGALSGTTNYAVWNVDPKNVRSDTQDPAGQHPAPFPVDLVEHALHATTGPGDRVLDPFMGSGTTAVAAILNGRDYVGFELDEDDAYQPLVERRIRDAQRQVNSSQNQGDDAGGEEADGDE